MINLEKLKRVLEGYKAYFPGHWKDERYKWEAISHFQRYWNLEAENFGEMFKQATEKTGNLLASGYAYPRTMILNFAKADDEAVRQMFCDLFYEGSDLAERVEAFQATAEVMRVKHDDGTWRNHYQNTNAISTYLWLRYPDKYYIYKYEMVRDMAWELEAEIKPKRNGSADTMLGGFRLYDEVCAAIQKDTELMELFHSALTDTPAKASASPMETPAVMTPCYQDPKHKTATMDIAFYLSRFFLPSKKMPQEEGWLPKDYSPELTVEDWLELLQDRSVFTPGSLQIMKRMADYGGQATCKQLSLKYGENSNFYNSGSSALARRVAKKTECPLMVANGEKDTLENWRWWPILYLGKAADGETEGSFLWKLRPELREALEKTDLSDVLLYVDNTPAIWKISHGTETTGIAEEDKRRFESRKVAVVHGETKAKAVSRTTQGQAFVDAIHKGDYFYLCYGSSIRLLGQFTGDKAVPNPELGGGWYEREYRLIAQAKHSEAYSGTQKWWTPNDHSTCIKVDKPDEPLFEELILLPYFHMTLGELFGREAAGHGYWWLAADPLLPPGMKLPKYSEKDFLDTVYMTRERYHVLKALLWNKKNIILQGAPGVGKTFTAKKLAYAMMGEQDESRVEMVQFHQNYSYEDFIMGYRPDGTGFTLTEGIFYRFCQRAAKDPERSYFFLIDEINRGNLSKIFGELLMLMEKDYRGTSVTLAYSGMPFIVPKNLYLIGMMNTADRSLAMIDYALRRRFGFFTIEPGFTSEGFMQYQNRLGNETFDALIDQIKALNKDIANDPSLGRGFRIGHSYFCGREPGECTADWMRAVVEFDLLPMLEEYWFDEPGKLQQWEKNLRGVFDGER